ncbi:recombinase family protein [Paraburkholderia adhaesiva]|uniref:recombinase family protein n=1 Tax=Paraburkholderia adhaesiva TaxID=2883244 RepID=UPI001F16C9FA|nr:recombinase family protein [Paraburkholderia adhaesiva]
MQVKAARTKAPAARPASSRRVYSYLRYSHTEQAKGSSIERQLAIAKEWATENNYELDESLAMRDEGRSAYHGNHVKNGALGAFLKEIEEGHVPEQSVLFVEQLDRLSRATVDVAMAQLLNIINAGITVVTGTDGEIYNSEQVRANPWKLMKSLVIMQRANEESESKSKRIRGAYAAKCKRWLETKTGTVGATRHINAEGKLVSGTDPSWVLYDQVHQRFELDVPQAQAMRRMIGLYLDGYGAIEITRRLEAEGLAISEKYPVTRVTRVIGSPALRGDKVVKADGQTFTLAGYYPALVTEAEWDELQMIVNKRGYKKGKGAIPSIVTGTLIGRCGYCGSLLATQNMNQRKRIANGKTTAIPDSPPEKRRRRLRCGYYYRTGQYCPSDVESCSAVAVERALMTYCMNQVNLDKLMTSDNAADPLMKQLVAKRSVLTKLDLKLGKLKQIMLESDDLPDTFMEGMRELEAEKREATKAAVKLERELKVHDRAKPSTAKAWAALVDDVLALDYDARMKVRKLIAETFERIDIFMVAVKDKGNVKPMHMRLTSKRGVVVGFDFHRLTGELVDEAVKVPSREKVAAGKHVERKPRLK